MVKNTKQISLMQQRHGKLNELPKQLSTAQFGFADDTNGLFIGNPDHPTLIDRYESDEFPYGNVEILTEFSDTTNLIKYSPWMNNKKLYYPLNIIGQTLYDNEKVKVGSSIKINETEIKFKNPGAFVEDCQYLLIRYIWNDNKDLDIKTTAINCLSNESIGWEPSIENRNGKFIPSTATTISDCYVCWGGDNGVSMQSPYEEDVLININNLEENNSLPNLIKFQLSGKWFENISNQPVRVEITSYNGGMMELNPSTKKFSNTNGGEQLSFIDENGNKVDSYITEVSNLSNSDYTNVGYIIINKETKSAIVSFSEFEIEDEISLEEVAKQINYTVDDVEARIPEENEIQLVTINESISLDYGYDISNPKALDILGIEPGIKTSESITKRSLQDVLDDRYSIKSFDVKGDGITDDSEKINEAIKIIYNTRNSDTKELYFPADTYIINSDSLILLTNEHLIGEGIDRTIIKSDSLDTMIVLSDWNLHKSNEQNYCDGLEYPHNILIEEMTFDFSESNGSELLFLNHCENVEFRNCKFIINRNNFIDSDEYSKIKNLKFNGCIFEGNKTNGQIIINGELDGLLITNCQFNNIQNTVIELNGDENYIQNGIIGNNKFTICSTPLIDCNENTRYISVVNTLVDNNVLVNNTDGKKILKSVSDNNYCDTPIYNTDPNKFLRFNFYQSVYDYVQVLYDKYGKEALKVISESNADVTNYLELKRGNSSNNDKITLNSTSQVGNVEIGIGQFGDLELGKKIPENNDYNEWNNLISYRIKEIVKLNNEYYICIKENQGINPSNNESRETYWRDLESKDDINNVLEFEPDKLYQKNDLIIHNDILYICDISHTSRDKFDETEKSNWINLGNYYSHIVLGKELDLNGNAICNNKENNEIKDNITFKVKDNIIVVDDSLSETEYKDKIGGNDKALTTVGYLNDVINSGERMIYNVDKINQQFSNENDSSNTESEITIMEFDPEKFGSEVYLKDVSLNIRQLFIPISEQVRAEVPLKCSYLEWNNMVTYIIRNTYSVNDIVYINNTFYKCIVEHETLDSFQEELDANYWEELTGHSGEEIPYEKFIKPLNTYSVNDIVYINNTFYKCIVEHETLDSFQEELDANYWEEVQNAGSNEYDNGEPYSKYEWSEVTWYKGDVVSKIVDNELRFFICKENHTSSILYSPDISFNNDCNLGKWEDLVIDIDDILQVIDTTGYDWIRNGEDITLVKYIDNNAYETLPQSERIINSTPDLRHISLKLVDSQNNNAEKYLFNPDCVNVVYRDTKGKMYEYYQKNEEYHKGDIVSHNYTNYKCKQDNLSLDTDDYSYMLGLHNSDIWEVIGESGFNYIFNFEKTLLEKGRNELTRQIEFYDEPYQLEHNVAGQTLKLVMYDENLENLEELEKDYDKKFESTNWAPETTFYVGQYVKYDNKIYCCNMTHTTTNEFKTIEDENSSVEENPDYSSQNQKVYFVDCNTSEIDEAYLWKSGREYADREYIKDGENIYQCLKYIKEPVSNIEEEIKKGNVEKCVMKYYQLGYSGEMILSVHINRG